ncbi:MAG: MFS transporter [Chloroflexi bacterium]|nr:MAG: MFS transporter [Chloroflexota bacterium]
MGLGRPAHRRRVRPGGGPGARGGAAGGPPSRAGAGPGAVPGPLVRGGQRGDRPVRDQAGLAVSPGPLFAAAFAPPAGRLADRFGHRAVLVPGALVFALGIGLYLTRVTTVPDYVGTWLLAACVTGIGVGLTLPTLGSSAAASLPPARFAAGSAVSNTSRQVGTVLGISFLVVLLGDVTGRTALAAFQRGWTMMLVLAAATSLICVVMGRTRAAGTVRPEANLPRVTLRS